MSFVYPKDWPPEWAERARKAHKKRGLTPAEVKKIGVEILKAEALVARLCKRRKRCAHPVDQQIVDQIDEKCYLFCSVCQASLGTWIWIKGYPKDWPPEWAERARKAHKKRGLTPAEVKKIGVEILKAEALVARLCKRRKRCAHPVDQQIVDQIDEKCYLFCSVCQASLGTWIWIKGAS